MICKIFLLGLAGLALAGEPGVFDNYFDDTIKEVDISLDVAIKGCLQNGDTFADKVRKAYGDCFGSTDYGFGDLAANEGGKDSDNDGLPDSFEGNEKCFYKKMGWVDGAGNLSPDAIKADLAGLATGEKSEFDDNIDKCASWNGDFSSRRKREVGENETEEEESNVPSVMESGSSALGWLKAAVRKVRSAEPGNNGNNGNKGNKKGSNGRNRPGRKNGGKKRKNSNTRKGKKKQGQRGRKKTRNGGKKKKRPTRKNGTKKKKNNGRRNKKKKGSQTRRKKTRNGGKKKKNNGRRNKKKKGSQTRGKKTRNGGKKKKNNSRRNKKKKGSQNRNGNGKKNNNADQKNPKEDKKNNNGGGGKKGGKNTGNSGNRNNNGMGESTYNKLWCFDLSLEQILEKCVENKIKN